MSEMTLVKVKVIIEGHKGQFLGQNSDFQHIAFWEIMVIEVEGNCKINRQECLPEHFDIKVLHID